jgi:hypothetical protein
MNNKYLVFIILALLLTSLLAYADIKTYDVDINNDGKDELVVVYQQYTFPERTVPYASETIVVVYKRFDFEKIGQFSMPERFDKIEFVSLNKDGVKQIVAWSDSGMHYTNIAIYGYKNGELYEIFENGSACLVETDFKAKRPMIKVGRENWEQEGWCYATGEPLWQVYVWNGKEFVYNKKLSTTPEISEQEATVRFINTVKERMQEIDSWHNKAIELRKEGKYNEAESLFKKIITAEPTNPNAHFDLGNVYFFEKRYNDALDYYNKSIDLGLDSEYIATYYYMSSLCYIGLGNNKEAIAYLKKCLKANPNYENAKELLELVEEAHKNGEKLNIEEEPIKSKVKGIFA